MLDIRLLSENHVQFCLCSMWNRALRYRYRHDNESLGKHEFISEFTFEKNNKNTEKMN